MVDTHDYWKDAYDGAAEEGGLGTYGLAEAQLGYFVYAAGYTGNNRIDECFFKPEKYGDKPARDAAKAKAQAFAKDNGNPQVRWCHALRLYRESCVRSDGTSVSEPTEISKGWDSDQFDPVPLWTLNTKDPSAAEARLEAMKQFGIQPGVQFYGRFAKQNDPYKVYMGVQDDEDQAGNKRYKQLWNVAEVYESKEAMLATIGLDAAITPTSDAPEGWDTETWKTVWVELWKAREAGQELSEIATAFGVTPGDVAKALKQYIPM